MIRTILLLISLLSLLTISCTTTQSSLILCSHKAVACALSMGEQYGMENVGIAVGQSAGARHTQAYIYIDKQMVWINDDCSSCFVGKKDPFIPKEFYSVDDYVSRHF